MRKDRVAFIGDVHGSLRDMKTALALCEHHDVEHIVQLGDFGFFWGPAGDTPRNRLAEYLTAHNQILHWLPGNHEDYGVLRDRGLLDATEPLPHDGNMVYLPRSCRWTWNSVRFMALGGAVSVDQDGRRPYFNWWSDEELTYSDMCRAFNPDTPIDVLLSHDAPLGVPLLEKHLSAMDGGSFFANPERWEELQRRTARHRDQVRTVVDSLKPVLVFHGHYHFAYTDALGSAQVWGLGANMTPGSLVILNLSTFQTAVVNDV